MKSLPFLALLPLAALAACGSSSDAPAGEATEAATPTSQVLGNATLAMADGKPAGTAELTGEGDTVKISIALSGLPEGTHAVHLHTTGKCEGPDFKSAGGHLNPGMKEHGVDNPKGAHLGDLPNVVIGADGTGTVTATLNGSRVEILPEIFDADGTAVMVHEGEDDNKSDPAGDAGSRIACGVLTAA